MCRSKIENDELVLPMMYIGRQRRSQSGQLHIGQFAQEDRKLHMIADIFKSVENARSAFVVCDIVCDKKMASAHDRFSCNQRVVIVV